MSKARTPEEVQHLFERDDAMEPDAVLCGTSESPSWMCPSCMRIFIDKTAFCPHCGQRWEEEDKRV